MGKKDKKKKDYDNDWEDEAGLDPDLLIAPAKDAAADADAADADAASSEVVDAKQAKKDKKKAKGKATDDAGDEAKEEWEQDWGKKKKGKKGGKAADDDDDDEDYGKKKKGKDKKGAHADNEDDDDDDDDWGKKKKKGKKSAKAAADDSDDEDFGKKKKKGKKGKHAESDEEEEDGGKKGGKKGGKAAEGDDDDDDFGKKKRGKKGKKGKHDDDWDDAVEVEAPVLAAADDDDFDYGLAKKKKKGKKGAKAADDDDELDAPVAAGGQVVAALKRVRPHPDAKKLQLCHVDAGEEIGRSVQVVCGATNLVEGSLVALSPLGSAVSSEGGPMAIKKAKVRGVESSGMLCGLGELGLAPHGGPMEVVVIRRGIAPGTPFEPDMIGGEESDEEEGDEEEAEEAEVAAAAPKASMFGAALGIEGDDDDDDDDDDSDAGGASASAHDAKTYEWLRGIEIGEADARAYAGAIHGAGMRSLSALLDASPGADALGKLRLKKGHVSLVRSEIAAARFAALAPPAAALGAWLRGIDVNVTDAAAYAPKLCAAGLGSASEIEAVSPDEERLVSLGLRRGHAQLLLATCRKALPPVPSWDFGPTRRRHRGPSALVFVADFDLPLFYFVEKKAAAEPEPAAEPEDEPKEKKKKKKKVKEEPEEEEAEEFDFGALPKKKKKPKEADADSDDGGGLDFGALPKKKKKPKEAEGDGSDDGIAFDFGAPPPTDASPPKAEKKKKKKKGDFADAPDAAAEAAAAEARQAAEADEIAAMMAELEAPEDEGEGITFSLSAMGRDEGEEGADADGAPVAVGGAAAEGRDASPGGKKKKKKGKAEAEPDDDDALLEAAMAEAAAARGEEGGGKKEKKKKKKKEKAAAGDDDDDALLGAAMAEAAEAKAAMAEADGGADADEAGDADADADADGGEGEGKLTKAQKKKLKAKANKAARAEAGEGDEGKKKEEKKKPASKLAQRLREEQERRAIEERAAETAAELSEEAQRLYKSLDVLHLGERALRQLDSAVVAKEVEELQARSDAALAEHPGHERLGAVASAVSELVAAMDDFLRLEESRRRKREKERERRERRRAEGSLMTDADRRKQAKQAAYLRSLGKDPDAEGGEGEGEGEVKKKVVYGKRDRKKKEAKGDAAADEGTAESGAAEAEPAAAPAEAPAEAAEEAPAEAEMEAPEAAWDDMDIDARLESSGLAVDDDSEEEEFVPVREPGLSSKLAALAASSKEEAEAAERKKEEVLNKLINFKPKEEGDSDASDDDDSDSDDDSSEEEDDAVELGKEAARKVREERLAEAMAARTPERLRSPICCIMGHVDTGKTKLLDNIRRTNVQDGEAGGITQQIGASFFPAETLRERMGNLVEKKKINIQVPGLMIIDTPGHESFSNLRSRGSSLCDVAILVIDIMHGLEPQTIESLNMLRSKKTPFVVALNKVDRLYGWEKVKDRPVVDALEEQSEDVKREFEDRASAVLLALAEQGLNAALYYRNKDFREYVSLIPTSAHTGEGVPDILMLLVQITQKMMVERIMWTPLVQCTVLEVKVVEGLGATADVILANGTLKRGDRIVMCGFGGAVVTRVRELLTPKPLREIRVKTDYLHHQSVDGAAGIKICANRLDSVVAGSACMVPYSDVPYDLEALCDEVMGDLNKLAKAASEVNGGLGVYAMASTLGSLEALLEFLKTSKIPVSAVNIGPIHKKDVIKASIMLEHKPEYATILAFDVNLTKEGGEVAKELGVKVFTAEIIYHLFDKFTAYMADVKKEKQEKAARTAVFPVIAEISSPEHVWCRGGGGDPILVGLHVKEGLLKVGTPLCVERRGQKDPLTGKQAYLDIGRVMSIEKDRKPTDKLSAGSAASVKIDAVTSIVYGRQFDHTYKFYARITRRSINAIREFFKDDLGKEDWALLLRLKKQFGVV